MKKTIWIINHYASSMFLQEGGRHFWFAERLKENGYTPIIFCASTIHNSDDSIDTHGQNYYIDNSKDFPFVFIKTPAYQGNGKQRIMNMYSFFRKLKKYSNSISKVVGTPDIIYASSVHPLSLVAGIKIGRKLNIPCICEIRDLWPLGLIEYGLIKDNGLLAYLLYKGEKWIYKNADAVIMTIEGCRQYIKDMGWEKDIDLNKVHYINNGIVLKDFDHNKKTFIVEDEDLEEINNKNIVYTGSIRKVNNLNILVDAAKIIQDKKYSEIKIIVYGEGDERIKLEERIVREGIFNIVFKGQVDKRYVASIVSKAYANILHYSTNRLDKYGQSQNKLFDYMAAEKPVISTYDPNYNIVTEYDCGLSIKEQTAGNVANVIIKMASDSNNYEYYAQNAKKGAKDFDFDILTRKLIKIIEG